MEIIEALEYIPPDQLDYATWTAVGMALKHEGYACEVWDDWSRSDSRYKEGECAKKWDSFREGTSAIVTGGTIFELAKRFGYNTTIRVYDWDDEIRDDGVVIKDSTWIDTSEHIEMPSDDKFNGPNELRRYLQALFKPDEIVGFCIDAEFDDEKKKWRPSTRGAYGMTAGQLLKSIKKHPNDIKAVIGDYNEEAGVWIRFNPLDGHGVSNSNVTDLRYALVESDNLELEKQKALMEELRIPIAVMLYSGGKSIHAIVKIDAINTQEYQEKVDYLYSICKKNGLSIDTQNKNASRMSRMPGVKRGDRKQFILAENIGCESFEEWKTYIEELTDPYPDIINFASLKELPELAPELIGGILRKGHKMLISGASKAGKSFLLIELALCICDGRPWLGFPCTPGKVLYVNLEVDDRSFLHRVDEVRKAMGIAKISANLDIWNLRGENAEIAKLEPRLIRRAQGKGYDAIIFDPLYKINEGDENSASEMGRFFNHLDTICTTLKTSIICCHHHSKGAQGSKFSIDRASGSGVFARDPDALLDMIQINPRDAEVTLEDGQTAWRISSTLREFMSPDDIDIIFDYPIHRVTDELADAKPISGADADLNSLRGNNAKKDKAEAKYTRLLSFVINWSEIDTKPVKTPYPTVEEAVKYFSTEKGFSDPSIRRWVKDHDELFIRGGMLIEKDDKNVVKQ